MEDGTFTPLENGSTQIPTYNKVPIPHYSIYWQTEAGSTEKKYKNSSGGFTIDASTATAALVAAVAQSSADPLIAAGLYYTVETEYKAEYVIDQNDTVSLPENGFDAAATDKVINPYVKQVGKTAQNRAVFDIVFGAAGAKDGDSQISNVGYILFYGDTYIDTADTKVSEEALESIANGAAVGTQNLTDDTLYPGSGKCRVAKYQAITSGTPSTNQVRLTNKNRVDLIIDVINDATSRNKFYTCYTYMIRGGQTYISNTPITFSPSEITLTDGGTTPTAETAYNLVIDNYYQNDSGSHDTVGGKNYTKANDYGYVLSNAYTFADGKNLTFTIRPLQPAGEIYKGKLVKLMAGSNEITPITSVEDGGQISYTFNTSHILAGDDTTNKRLRLKAYFDPTPVAAKFTLNATEGIEYKVYFDGVLHDTVTTTNKDIAVPFGTTVRVEAQTVLVNGKEGYAITDATKGRFDLADDSTRTKSQMAVREVTVTDGMTSADLQDAIGTQPTATPLFYTVTVQEARGHYNVNLTYDNENAVSIDSNVVNNASAKSSETIKVWQGNPVITLSNTSGNYVLTAGTNTSVSGDTITVTDDAAVFTIGGFATLTLSPVDHATTVVTVNGNDTTIDTANQVVDVPYNFDETTGTDVTVTVTAGDGYVISKVKNYIKSTPKVAAKTVKLTNNPSVLTNTSLTNLPDVAAGYVLTVNAGTGGSVTVSGTDVNGSVSETITAGNNATYTVVSGTVFTLSAVAGSNYTFNNWTGSHTGTTASNQQITVNADKTVTANFDEIIYTLTVSAGTGGTVSNVAIGGTNATAVVDNGNGTYTVGATKASGVTFTLTAIPNDSYGFTNWTNAGGTELSTSNPYTITDLSGDTTVTANFSQGILVTLDTSINVYNSGTENWGSANAKIFIYADNPSTNTSKWFEMSQTSTNLYSALVENGYTKIVFVRKSPSGTAGNWSDKWAQTPTDSDRYTISQTAKDWIIVGQEKAILKKTHTINLDPSATVYGTERWAIIYKNATTEWIWVNMTGSGTSYTADIPAGYDTFAICRMNGSTTTNNFDNRWNYSSDLAINYVTYPTSGGTTVITTDWGSSPLINVNQS